MIKYDKAKERNNQAEVYRILTDAGLQCCLEVPHKGRRLDVVVYDEDRVAVCIVEVKRGYLNREVTETVSQQLDEYSKFGLPVYLVNGTKTLFDVCEEIINKYVVTPIELLPWPKCCFHP